MENQYSNLIGEFEANLLKIIEQYKTLREENRTLKAILERKNGEIMEAHKQIVDLKNEYSNLETAASLGGSLEEKDKAKQHLNKIVREIDKCLTLLNE